MNDWKSPASMLLVVSALFLAWGIWHVVSPNADCYEPTAPITIAGLGLAGLAFSAWLKR